MSNEKLFSNQASQETWGKPLDEAVMNSILTYSECHAYYFNKLCSLVWQNGNYPSAALIDKIWSNFVLENKSIVEREISLLTLNQRKLLSLLAESDGTTEPFGKTFLSELHLSNSSTARAMTQLTNKDYVYIDTNTGKYNVLDPLIKSVLDN